MTSAGWNYADVWDAVARRTPDSIALLHGPVSETWGELERRAEGIAAALVHQGLSRQAKVAQYQRNSPAYVEVLYACFKASLVPVNTNFRYGDEELRYLWTNSDAEAVVFDEEFDERVDRLRTTLPAVRCWIRVGGRSACPDWAIPYEDAATADAAADRLHDRSGDDLYLLYTGGTTGRPKGVMWRQDDLFRVIEQGQGTPLPDPPEVDAFLDQVLRPSLRGLPAAPLMHGTAAWFSMPILARGGSIVTLESRSFDVEELLDAMTVRSVKSVCIVGDAFARPMIAALQAHPDRWDLSALRVIASSGAMLSGASRTALLDHAPRATVVDALGSSETGSFARSTTTSDGGGAPAGVFTLSERTRVIDEDGADIAPGSGRHGRLAIGGNVPLGYYGDPEKTAATFTELDGRRFVITGDWAEVSDDGRIRLLGRGSSCINTAGEKVYPEEVEEALKDVDGVLDAGVVGVPDERLGQAVAGVVVIDPASETDAPAITSSLRDRLASFKIPRHLVVVDVMPRGPNGKLDHSTLRQLAESGSRSAPRH